MLRFFVTVVLVAALLAPADRTLALPPLPASSSGRIASEFVPGELLVKFRPAATAQGRKASVATAGHTYLAALDAAGWVHVKAAPGQTVEQAVRAYARDSNVEWAQPNYIYHAAAVPNDPGYGQLWGWKNTGQTVTNAAMQPAGAPIPYATNNPPAAGGSDMNLEKAWDQVTDCSGVAVAVVDSGVNYTHEDLAANMWNGGASFPNHGYNFVAPISNDPMDLFGHGTHVAGTIGAVGNNSKGVTGVCWKATLMAVRVLGATGTGTTASIIQGINFAVAHSAKVINMSLSGGGAFDQAYADAITAAQAADVLLVVAAGNDSSDNEATARYPCNFTQPNLVCVAALDQAYQLASFSNYGAVSVDVGAPGTNVVSTWPGSTIVMSDPLTGTGWTASTTTAGGWATLASAGGQYFIDPATYPSPSYNANTDDRAYKSFALTGANAAVLDFLVAVDVANGDHFRVAEAATAVDPFAGTPNVALDVTNVQTAQVLQPLKLDVSACVGANCTIGLQLQSGAAPLSPGGVAIRDFTITSLTLNTTSYNTEMGTSMATPAVAGVAAMLRAYNPQFTFLDVASAIRGGGRSVAALVGKTTTGKAVDAMGSLAFISPPTGVAATVH